MSRQQHASIVVGVDHLSPGPTGDLAYSPRASCRALGPAPLTDANLCRLRPLLSVSALKKKKENQRFVRDHAQSRRSPTTARI